MSILGRRFSLYSLFIKALNILATLFFLTPLVLILLSALQTERSLVENYMTLVPTLTTQNFMVLLTGNEDILPNTGFYQLPQMVFRFKRAFINSVIVATTTTILNLSLGSLAAYAVARLRFRWAKTFMYVNLGSRLVPLIVLMVPLFVILRQLKLLNSLTGIILALTGFLLPYTIWILHAFFVSLPEELEDAARIDGCTRFGSFVRIVLPLSAPGIAAAGVIVFILSWNEFLIPLIVTSNPEVMPVTVVIASLIGDFHVYFSLAAAAVIVGLLPTVILALLLQRYIVQGLVSGALKG